MTISIKKRSDGSLEAIVKTDVGEYLLDNQNRSHEGLAIYELIKELYYIKTKKE